MSCSCMSCSCISCSCMSCSCTSCSCMTLSGVLYFVSATVNPILYNVVSKRYRKAFKDTLCRSCCYRACWQRPLHSKPPSTSYTHYTSSGRGHRTSSRNGQLSSSNRRAIVRALPNHYAHIQPASLHTRSTADSFSAESQKLLKNSRTAQPDDNYHTKDDVSRCNRIVGRF